MLSALSVLSLTIDGTRRELFSSRLVETLSLRGVILLNIEENHRFIRLGCCSSVSPFSKKMSSSALPAMLLYGAVDWLLFGSGKMNAYEYSDFMRWTTLGDSEKFSVLDRRF